MSFEMYLIQSEFDNNDTLLSFFICQNYISYYVFFRICHPNRVELVWASLLTVVKIVCSLFGY